VIEASAACAPMVKYRRPLYLDEPAHAVTFTVALARKDTEVTAALARQLGVAMPQGSETLARLWMLRGCRISPARRGTWRDGRSALPRSSC